jgi:hypothetical protein
MTEEELREKYLEEDWGKFLDTIGFDPVNTESAARMVAREAAYRLYAIEKLANETIQTCACGKGDMEKFQERVKRALCL